MHIVSHEEINNSFLCLLTRKSNMLAFHIFRNWQSAFRPALVRAGGTQMVVELAVLP